MSDKGHDRRMTAQLWVAFCMLGFLGLVILAVLSRLGVEF